jgi:2-polyprenyl-3-methyl-5-hydroxy-6-metoxy-1,4-benzoquinol methylase
MPEHFHHTPLPAPATGERDRMASAITKAELQLCIAVKNIRKPACTCEDLRAFGEMAFKEELADWSEAVASFCERGFLRAEEGHYCTTAVGEQYVERVSINEFLGRMILRSEQSPTFARFCERVYGQNLTQYGAADMAELAQMLALLRLNETSLVLDVGCGIGATSEYISYVTGARVTGIDLADLLIERAQERTRDKANRLRFEVANINEPALPAFGFDCVLSIDTLYFAKDLAKTIGQLKAALKPGGQMGLFYTEVVTDPTGSREQLAADQTRLARALQANDLAFTTLDLTDSTLRFWERSQQVLAELKSEFETEGNPDLCAGRLAEGESVLELAKAGRMTRYLYHIRIPA